MAQWTLDSIPWTTFDSSKVNRDLLVLAKTASVVEYNSADYVAYLNNVFPGDTELQKQIAIWGDEEMRHGLALARWAEMADPQFNFQESLEKFRTAFQVPVDATASIRGSRSAELVARCLVECGTTTFYSSLADASEEPVFKRICKLISMDEVHHYNLFYRGLQKYLEIDKMSVVERCRVALSRTVEATGEELLYAYAATNEADVHPDDVEIYEKEYLGRALSVYTLKNLRVGMKMASRAAGLEKYPSVAETLSRAALWGFQKKAQKFNRQTSDAKLF